MLQYEFSDLRRTMKGLSEASKVETLAYILNGSLNRAELKV